MTIEANPSEPCEKDCVAADFAVHCFLQNHRNDGRRKIKSRIAGYPAFLIRLMNINRHRRFCGGQWFSLRVHWCVG